LALDGYASNQPSMTTMAIRPAMPCSSRRAQAWDTLGERGALARLGSEELAIVLSAAGATRR
jgi:hypothetical protein